MKYLSTISVFIIAILAIACSDINDNSTTDVINKVSHYLKNEDYASIKALSDTINKDPELGLDIVNCTKDSSAIMYETMIASMVFPQVAAKIVITDMLNMPLSESNQKLVKSRVNNIISTYSKIGRCKNVPVFKNSIDSCFSTLSVNEQAKLYTLSTSPSQLGKIIKSESNNKALIEAIKLQYSNQSDIVSFQNALK